MAAAPDGEREQAWNEIMPVTIDVGIMERASRVAVIPCDMGWNDIGSLAALSEILACDEQRNVILGQGQHIGLGTTDSLIYSEGRLIATIGLENLIVVDAGDAVLVLPRDRAQEVSALVKTLQARGLSRYL
jgi:mannose-1-phosphate guanylyltransferase